MPSPNMRGWRRHRPSPRPSRPAPRANWRTASPTGGSLLKRQERRISPIPVGSGEGLPDGVADGGGGALGASVGVGTGGSVSVGRGSGSAGDPAVDEALGTTTGRTADADGAPGPVPDVRDE